jgi:predicted amidohydrolase YtcJ
MARGSFAPQESLSLDDSLSLYTSNANSNGLDEVGSVMAVGADANLTLLDSDLEGMHPAIIRSVGIAATFVDGRLVFSSTGT